MQRRLAEVVVACQSYWKAVKEGASDAELERIWTLNGLDEKWMAVASAVKYELRLAGNGQTTPEQADAAIDRMADEIAARLPADGPDGAVLGQIVNGGNGRPGARDIVKSESVETAETNIALFEVELAQDAYDTISRTGSDLDKVDAETVVADAKQAFVDALEREVAVLIARNVLDDAHRGVAALATVHGNIRNAMMPDAQEALGLAQAQFAAAQSGTLELVSFTNQQLDDAIGAIRAIHPDLNPAAFDFVGADLKIRRELADIDPEDPSLSQPERKLAETDPVSLGLIRALGETVDPSNPGLAGDERQIERRLAESEPVLFALLQVSGIRIVTDNRQITSVTAGGETKVFDADKFLRADDLAGLALALLDQHAASGPEILGTLEAAAEHRLDWTRAEVDRLMSHAPPDRAAALKVLSTNLDAAFPPEQRDLVWEEVGRPHFNQQTFEQEFREIRTAPGTQTTLAMDRIGEYMLELLEHAPPEVADAMLDAVKVDFGDDWWDTNAPPKGGEQNGARFFAGLSLAVDLASTIKPGRADEFAAWLATTDTPQSNLLYVLGNEPGGPGMRTFPGVREAIAQGYGLALAEAVAERVKNSPAYAGLSEPLDEAIANGREESGEVHANKVTRAQFDNFQANQVRIKQDFFDNFLVGDNITEFRSIADGPALRNLIGRGLGLAPDNPVAARAEDNSVDWFTDSDDVAMINLVAGWITRTGGDDGEVAAVPIIYVSERDGVQHGALFRVKDGGGEETIIDGLAADDVIAMAETEDEDGTVDGGEASALARGEVEHPWRYDSVRNLKEDSQYDDDGTIYLPRRLELRAGADGHVDLDDIEGIDAAIWTTEEKLKFGADALFTVVLVASGVALGVGALALGAGLGITGIGWNVFRTLDQAHTMRAHGQSTDKGKLALALVESGASLLAMGAAMRAITLSRHAANLVRTSGQFGRLVSTTGAAKRTALVARGSNWVAQGTGAPAVLDTVGAMTTDWDRMNLAEKFEAVGSIGLTIGAMALGAGANRLVQNYRPRSTVSPRRTSETNPIEIYETGPDGVSQRTGRFLTPEESAQIREQAIDGVIVDTDTVPTPAAPLVPEPVGVAAPTAFVGSRPDPVAAPSGALPAGLVHAAAPKASAVGAFGDDTPATVERTRISHSQETSRVAVTAVSRTDAGFNQAAGQRGRTPLRRPDGLRFGTATRVPQDRTVPIGADPSPAAGAGNRLEPVRITIPRRRPTAPAVAPGSSRPIEVARPMRDDGPVGRVDVGPSPLAVAGGRLEPVRITVPNRRPAGSTDAPAPVGRLERVPPTDKHAGSLPPKEPGGELLPWGSNFGLVRQVGDCIDTAIRHVLPDYARPAYRVRSLDDGSFVLESFKRFGRRNIHAFTAFGGAHGDVVNFNREHPPSVDVIAHDLMHPRFHPQFRALASRLRQGAGDPFRNLHEAAADWFALNLSHLAQGRPVPLRRPGGKAANDRRIEPIEPWRRDLEAFERIRLAMRDNETGDAELFRALFEGDAAALERFRLIALDGGIHAEHSGSAQALAQSAAKAGDQTPSVPEGGKPPSEGEGEPSRAQPKDVRSSITTRNRLDSVSLPTSFLIDLFLKDIPRGSSRQKTLTGRPTLQALSFGRGLRGSRAEIKEAKRKLEEIRKKHPVDSDQYVKAELELTRLRGKRGNFTWRPTESRNITGAQLAMWPLSIQDISPVRGSKLFPVAEAALFAQANAPYTARPANLVKVGEAADRSGSVFEATYRIKMNAKGIIDPPADLVDFLGTPVQEMMKYQGHRDGPVAYEVFGQIPLDRLMKEKRYNIRSLRRYLLWGTMNPTIMMIPRTGVEKRPEFEIKTPPGKGDIISGQMYDQIQSQFDWAWITTQFIVKDPAAAARLDAMSDNSVLMPLARIRVSEERQAALAEELRDLATSGGLVMKDGMPLVKTEATAASGLRIASVPDKELYKSITDLVTGKDRLIFHPDQCFIDVVFQASYKGPFKWIPNPDLIASRMTYKLRWRHEVFKKFGTPQSHNTGARRSNVPELYAGPQLEYAHTSTRWTWYIGTPHIPLIPGLNRLSGEYRLQWKTERPTNKKELTPEGKPRPEAPVITKYIRKGRPNEILRFDDHPSGLTVVIGVPKWLTRARNLITSGKSPLLMFPVGGKVELDGFLKALESRATPRQRWEIVRFREDVMSTLEENASLGPKIEEIFSFFKKMSRPNIDLPAPDMVHLAPPELQRKVVDWYLSQGYGPYTYRSGEGWQAKGGPKSDETPG